MMMLIEWYKERLRKKYRAVLIRHVGAILAAGSGKLVTIMVHPKSTPEQILRAAEAYKNLYKVVQDTAVRIERHVKKEVE